MADGFGVQEPEGEDNRSSLSNTGNSLFGATYPLRRPGQVRPTVVGQPWAVCPRLVLVDKFHEVKNPEPAIYCRLQGLRAYTGFCGGGCKGTDKINGCEELWLAALIAKP